MSVDARTNTLTIERHLEVDIAAGFALISQSEQLARWWGPRGITLGSHQLDLGAVGPWHSVMIGEDGGWHKVSGEVLQVEGEVENMRSVDLTWAWHDRVTEKRGHESHVRLEVCTHAGTGIILTLRQTGFADLASARLHGEGWESSLDRIADIIGR